MSVLLVFPPFAMPNKPYLSLPALAAYLKANGIQTAAFDANLHVLQRLTDPGFLEKRAKELAGRLMELDARTELSHAQKVEYLNLRRVCRQSAQVLAEPQATEIFTGQAPYAQKTDRLRQAALLATARHFPEHLDFTAAHGYLRYYSTRNIYSSAHILADLQNEPFYAAELARGLDANIERHKPSLVGISLCFPEQMLPAFHCARLIKHKRPGLPVVLGGPVVSCNLRKLKNPGLLEHVDALVLDDGEEPLLELARQTESGRPDFSRAPGLIYPQGGELRSNPPNPPLPLGELPAPDFSVLPQEGYLEPPGLMGLGFRLSRGCQWARCIFCNTRLSLVKHYHELSVEQAEARLKVYMDQYQARFIQFTDDSSPPLLLEGLSQRIAEQGYKMGWSASLRFSPELTLERCLTFRRGGCHTLYFGLETLVPRLSKLIKKGITQKLVRDVLFNVTMAGISAKVYMMVGLPGETEEEARQGFTELLDLVKKGWVKGAQYSRFEISPYSGAALHPADFGLSNLRIGPDSDLNPPVSQFDMPGMGVAKADQLQAEFSRRLAGTPDPTELKPVSRVNITGRDYPLTQPVLKLRAEVLANPRS